MKNRIFPILLLAGIPTLFLSSCVREYNCIPPLLELEYVNYSTADLRVIRMRKFEAGSNFQNALDSIQLNNDSLMLSYTTRNDTTSVNPPSENFVMRPGFDWQISIPATEQTFSISGIVAENRKEKRGWGLFNMDPGKPCRSPTYLAVLNGQTTYFPNAEESSSKIYLIK